MRSSHHVLLRLTSVIIIEFLWFKIPVDFFLYRIRMLLWVFEVATKLILILKTMVILVAVFVLSLSNNVTHKSLGRF